MYLKQFPNSIQHPFIETSEKTPNYNCIAWAYGCSNLWIWPEYHPESWWPSNIPRVNRIEHFISLFEGIGYEVCGDDILESGFEKVAIYVGNNGLPTHAARQLQTGLWTSKLGKEIDISHSIAGMDGGSYGSVGVYMKRPNKDFNVIQESTV